MRAKAAFPSFQDLSSSRPALIVPLVLAILALAACGSPTSGSDDSSTSSDTGSNNTTTTNDVSFTANSGDRRVTLTDWGDSDSVDIYWSTDPGCDWSSYTTCDDSGMLSGEDVSSDGAEVVITVAGDGLRADEPHFFVAEPAGGSARYRSDVAGARPFIYHLNGNVYSSVEMGDYVYVGGDFTRQHVSTGGGLAVAADDGTTVDSLPLVDGSIEAVQADGSGGWFIGGDFGRVAGKSRRNLAHVNALGQVTDWNPGIPGGQVKALELRGESDTLYVGGDFVLNEGESNERRDLAAFATTGIGALRGWQPRVGPEDNEDVAVHALAIGGDSIYVGGTFTKVYDENDGFASQSRLAAFDLQEGKRRSGWADPGVGDGDPTTVVHALLHIPADRIANQDDGVVLVGGNFSSAGVNEGDRDNAAVYRDVQGGGDLLGTDDLNVTTFDGDVRDVRLHDDYVYIVGDFDNVDVDDGTQTTTTARPGIAAVHLKEADDDSHHPGDLVADWTPDANITTTSVHGLSILGDVEDGSPMFFLAGDFRFRSGGVTIANAMALDADGDLVTAWNPAPNREARAVAAQDLEDGARVYLGGIFNRAAGKSHEYLMANEVDTGRLVWPEGSPTPDGSVLALAGNGAEDTLFLGGTFGDLEGDAYLSALSLDTDTDGELVGITHDAAHFDVSPDAPVLTLLADDTDNLYVGGAFGSIGGNAHSRLALFDNSGGLDAWDPALADGPVWSLAHGGTNKVLYAGGAFTSADGDRLLGFDTDNGHAAVSLPEPNQPVYAMAWNDDQLYIGGEFTDVNDGNTNTRQRLAAVDTTDNSLAAWAPSIGDGYSRDQVSAIAHHDGTIFVGGSFNELDGEPRQNVAALDDTGAVLNNWIGDTNGAIHTLSTGSNADGPVLFLGGSFGTVRNEPFSRFTAIGIDYDELIWAPR